MLRKFAAVQPFVPVMVSDTFLFLVFLFLFRIVVVIIVVVILITFAFIVDCVAHTVCHVLVIMGSLSPSSLFIFLDSIRPLTELEFNNSKNIETASSFIFFSLAFRVPGQLSCFS